MKKTHLMQPMLLILIAVLPLAAQTDVENETDRVLRGPARVNPSTLAVEVEIPLTNYRGRGIGIPLSISYSSKVWRLNHRHSQPVASAPGTCRAINEARFSENSAAGWTTSAAVPFIRYVGADDIYDSGGRPAGNDHPACAAQTPNTSGANAWVRRVALHLPSGEVHELRMNDEVLAYDPASICGDDDPQTICDPNDPALTGNWNGWYYAADGSNIRYFEDRTGGVYFVQMPDGSKYFFNGSIGHSNGATVRRAEKVVDRNGNFNAYHEPDANFPNGYWIDTIGRVIPIPFRPEAPAGPGVQVFGTPGLGGQNIWYKFHWKQLKGPGPEESALTDYRTPLRFAGDRFVGGDSWHSRPPDQALFTSDSASWVIDPDQRFNPVVLAGVELPTGQQYRFSYNVYGEIETITTPTGGQETFSYSAFPSISDFRDLDSQLNRGAASRAMYQSPGAPDSYVWQFAAQTLNASSTEITIVNPDGSRIERTLYRGNAANSADSRFGFDRALAGMEFEERVFSAANRIVSVKRANWTRTVLPVTMGGVAIATADWHPRVVTVEFVRYDELGDGFSATTEFEFNDTPNLDRPETPLLTKTIRRFGVVPVGAKLPLAPIRTSVSTYLISDESLPASTRDGYRNANLVGLVSASEFQDGAGNVTSRTETLFDETGNSAPGPRGNPTTIRIWDSALGSDSNPSAYAVTRNRFDDLGNQIETIDALGHSTITEYDEFYRAFPHRVTRTVPDPTGTERPIASIKTVSVFDASSGLQTSETDISGLETRFEYDPVTLRIRAARAYYQGIETGTVTETFYSDEPGNNRVTTRTRLDADNWSEQTVFLDGFGREFKTRTSIGADDVFVQKEFDHDGRTRRVSNPFRNGEPLLWTTYEFDEAGRLKKITGPDGSTVTTDWGVLMGDLIGTAKTVTDGDESRRRSVVGVLERTVADHEDQTGPEYSTG